MHDVPLVFSLAEDGVTRKETPLIPKAVIREALVNAVTNRDYEQGGSNPDFRTLTPHFSGSPKPLKT